MTNLALSLACIATDRTRPVIDGRAPIEGCTLKPFTGEPEEVFTRSLRDKEFDISEVSMSSHMVLTAGGEAEYIGIPIFTSRAFRHSSVFVRTDRGIRSLADLKGKRIGLTEYQQTAALWMRGTLFDECDVRAQDITWVRGGLEKKGHGERVPIHLPASIRVEDASPETSLNAMLEEGSIDAIMSPRAPSCVIKGAPSVGRLFPDYESIEAAYAKSTGFFPIMHCMAVRRSLAQTHPTLPAAIFRAFVRAKKLALDELTMTNVLRVSLPWAPRQLELAEAILGKPAWSYGLDRNRHEVATMARYAHIDGLTARQLAPEDLFDASTLSLSDE